MADATATAIVVIIDAAAVVVKREPNGDVRCAWWCHQAKRNSYRVDTPPGTSEGEESLAETKEEGTTAAKSAVVVVVVGRGRNGDARRAG